MPRRFALLALAAGACAALAAPDEPVAPLVQPLVVGPGGTQTALPPQVASPRGTARGAKGEIYAAGRREVWRVDGTAAKLHAPANAFPREPKSLQGVALDPESGSVYVSDAGDRAGEGGAVYRVAPNGTVTLVTDAKRLPGLKGPLALALDGASFLLVGDAGGTVWRVRVADGTGEAAVEGVGAVTGLAWDYFGRLYGAARHGRIWAVPKPGAMPVTVPTTGLDITPVAGVAFDHAKNVLQVRNPKGGITAVPANIPGHDVDASPLPLATEVAFPKVEWTGWTPETESGKANVFRPIALTHAGDGTGRAFVATQQGVIHILPAKGEGPTKVFLDLTDRVKYDDRQNEEGFLGMAFHPDYKGRGELFVFYTPKKENGVNVVSRFRVDLKDADKGDPASEEPVLRFEKPYWNHDGGTIAFGPDGLLYVTHGDGGLGNDPHDHGQDLSKPLGKILRVDVNAKENGKNYAVPKDNPFAGRTGAAGEIYAYGLRNVWRMSFDRETGHLWAADVGQNLYEEINLIRKGGNYGWNRREALHPFGARGAGPSPEFIDPIWEYHHDVGRSITGGAVYRGEKFPELKGHYVYADYVTAKIWALKYDEVSRRVTANRPIEDQKRPILSFGSDEAGELYLLTTATNGKGVFRLVKK